MVKTIAEARQSVLADQRVPVRMDYRYALMHDKFIVFDA
jgi:hypothetical protein